MSEPKSNTDIIQSPPASFVVAEFKQRVQELLDYSQKRVIANDEDAVGAVDDLSIIAVTTKALDERRKEYTGPLNERVKDINLTFKTVSDPLALADEITRQKLQTYRDEQKRKHYEEEKLNRDKLELARREMEAKGELAPRPDHAPGLASGNGLPTCISNAALPECHSLINETSCARRSASGRR